VITAVDELHASQELTDQTLEMLRDNLSEAAAVEVILVAGQYTMLSMLANSTGSLRQGRPIIDF